LHSKITLTTPQSFAVIMFIDYRFNHPYQITNLLFNCKPYLCPPNFKIMKWLNTIIKYRLWIGIVFLAVAIFTNIQAGFWPSFVLYLIAVIAIVGHFLFGPMRLIQSYMEEGDMAGAKKVVDSIWFPAILIKPVRSVYYTIKGNLDMVDQNFEGAEKNMKRSLALGSGALTKQAEGPNKLQLGMLMMQKGDIKQAESYIRQAIRAGLPDNENNAAAYLQLCSIMMNKREFRAAKDYFRKAKGFKPTTPQIVDQIKQIEKYITRMPG
jgi:tetratricopeptide (TPR) repeat protein